MNDPRGPQFCNALLETERSQSVQPLTERFADECQLTNLGMVRPARGRDGAHDFWQNYLRQFRHIKTEFDHVHQAGDVSILEWNSSGQLPDGSPIHYRGVSIVCWNGDKVTNFRTYYDTAAFLKADAVKGEATQ